MGKMYTLKPDESINDHVKESMSIINRIVELSIGCMRDLANPHEGTFVDMTFDNLMLSLEHIRNSIEMLDELTDELEESSDEVRREYEEKVIQFFNRFMNSDLTDEYEFRMKGAVKNIHEIENHYMSEIQKLNAELENERERSNQLEKELSRLRAQHGELTKRCAKLVSDRDSVVEYWTKHCENLFHEHRKSLAAKDREIANLTEERDYFQDCLHKLANRASNFCGNCSYCVKDPCEYHCKHPQVLSWTVDPDDASCPCFKSNCDRDKPDQPCCKACNRDDCDNCTLCPF